MADQPEAPDLAAHEEPMDTSVSQVHAEADSNSASNENMGEKSKETDQQQRNMTVFSDLFRTMYFSLNHKKLKWELRILCFHYFWPKNLCLEDAEIERAVEKVPLHPPTSL